MDPSTRIVGCLGLALLTSSGISHAQEWTDNLYVHTDIGPTFIQSAPTAFRLIDLPPPTFHSLLRMDI